MKALSQRTWSPFLCGLLGALLGAAIARSPEKTAGAAREQVTRLKTLEVDVLFAKEVVVADKFDPDVVAGWSRLMGPHRKAHEGSAYIAPWTFKLESQKGAVLAAVTPGHLELLGEKTKGRIIADADGIDGRAEVRLFQRTPGRDYSVIAAGKALETHNPPR